MRTIFLSFFFLSFSLSLPLSAGYQLKNGKAIREEYIAESDAENHYQKMLEAFYQQEWQETFRQSTILSENFPSFSLLYEAPFYQGVGYFYKKEYECANEEFTRYLEKKSIYPLSHFEEAIKYKLQIAEMFREGEKKRIFGLKGAPKWLSGKRDALKIYDEILTYFYNHEFSAQALFSKGRVLMEMKRFEESIATLDIILERFPQTEWALKTYQELSSIYQRQITKEPHHPDLLFLAEANRELFHRDFPYLTEQNQEIGREMEFRLEEMRKVCAAGILGIAQFYERKELFEASQVYYQNIIKRFPHTPAAQKAEESLQTLIENEKLPVSEN